MTLSFSEYVPRQVCVQASSINNTNTSKQILNPPLPETVSSAAGQPSEAWITEASQQEQQLEQDEAENILLPTPFPTPHKAPTLEAESAEKKPGKSHAFYAGALPLDCVSLMTVTPILSLHL